MSSAAVTLWREALQQLQESLIPNEFVPAEASSTFVLAMADATAAELIPGLTDTLEHEAPSVFLRVVPLTAGLGRGTLIPLLRPGEVLIILTLAAMAVRLFLDRRQDGPPRFNLVDAVITAFVAFAVLVPAVVLIFDQADVEVTTWMTVLGPVQFLVVYWIYSRSGLDRHEPPGP